MGRETAGSRSRWVRFVNRFNHRVDAVQDFSRNYNANHTLDLKRIKALRTAWHDLEKDSGFLKPGEHEGSEHRRARG